MKRRTGTFLSLLLGAIVAAFAALNVLAYRHARAMLYYSAGGDRTRSPETLDFWGRARVLLSGVNVPRPGCARRVSELGPGWRDVKIPVHESITLAAWHCPDASADAPMVILFHGYSASKEYLLAEAGMFRDFGMSAMLVDFRGSGGSSECYTTLGFLEGEDVAAAVRYARQEFQPPAIVLYGHSMGAVAVLRSIHSHGVEADAIILEAVFDTMLNAVRNRFRSMQIPAFPSAELLVFWGGVQSGFKGFAHRPVDYTASVSCPTLFLHGAGDPRARMTDAKRVYDAVSVEKRFVEFTGVGHESCAGKCPERWLGAVDSFLAGCGGIRALQGFQSAFEPGVRHTIEEEQRKDVREDESGDPPTGGSDRQ